MAFNWFGSRIVGEVPTYVNDLKKASSYTSAIAVGTPLRFGDTKTICNRLLPNNVGLGFKTYGINMTPITSSNTADTIKQVLIVTNTAIFEISGTGTRAIGFKRGMNTAELVTDLLSVNLAQGISNATGALNIINDNTTTNTLRVCFGANAWGF